MKIVSGMYSPHIVQFTRIQDKCVFYLITRPRKSSTSPNLNESLLQNKENTDIKTSV